MLNTESDICSWVRVSIKIVYYHFIYLLIFHVFSWPVMRTKIQRKKMEKGQQSEIYTLKDKTIVHVTCFIFAIEPTTASQIKWIWIDCSERFHFIPSVRFYTIYIVCFVYQLFVHLTLTYLIIYSFDSHPFYLPSSNSCPYNNIPYMNISVCKTFSLHQFHFSI